ncbi:MAG: hypothetical protein JWN46_1469, partial [Acidimicrobiales bacterium]|nr:hypothetical protein [Acidimicrobiales bacterium]
VRGGPAPHADAAGAGAARSTASPIQPLRRLAEPIPPSPVSARPGVGPVKKLIRRLIGWEIDPLREQVTALQRATTEAVGRVEAERHDGSP